MEMRRLGRKAIKRDSRTLMLAKYLTATLPAPAPSLSYLKDIAAWGMLGNDTLGDCTCAAVGHAVQVWTANAGVEANVTNAEVIQIYENWCGYNPADPSTDQGGIILDVLNDWKNSGFGTFPMAAFASVNPSNTRELKQAIELFGGVDIGINLPISAQSQTVWDVVPDDGSGNTAPGSWGGHCVFVPAYGGTNKVLSDVTCITWGAPLKMTVAFWKKYVDEAYALLSPQWFTAAGGAPNGFNLAQLEADLAAIK